MATKLNAALKRELTINGEPYMLTIAPEGLKLTVKGRRKGHELAWKDLVSGDAALAVALNASLAQTSTPAAPSPQKARNRPVAGKVENRKPPRKRAG
jgi:hypothetical protein